MSYCLFLDDERMPINAFTYTMNQRYVEYHWVIVRSYKDFIKCIENNGMPSIISFDHDLGDVNNDNGEKTGYDCVKWLIDYCMDNKCEFPQYMFHTMNNVGKENMELLIQNYIKFLQRGRL